MKYFILFLLSFSTTVFSSNEFPMSGIDGVLNTTSSRGYIELTDIDGNAIVLSNQQPLRLRLSTQSNTIHFMKGNGHKQDIKIHKGFPRNDLRNFFLKGEDIQQDFDLEGRTDERLLRRYTRSEYDQCHYFCGRDRLGRPLYCYGSQLVQSTYDVYRREFMMSFRPTTKNPIQVDYAQFKGIVGDFEYLIGRYPIGYCR